ncbi:MAG: hypothetical protein QXX79_07115 [Candidatus Bathyarchaeia archaeon]
MKTAWLKMALTNLIQYVLHIASAGIPKWLWPKFLTNLVFGIVWFFVELLILTVVLYLAGQIVVGGKRALFSDAFIIALLGTVLTTLFIAFVPYSLIAILLSVFVWLLLIKRLYETGWLGAIAVGIIAVIIFIAVLVLIALVFGVLYLIIEWFVSMWLYPFQ